MSQPETTTEKPRRRINWTLIIALTAVVMTFDWNRIACHYLSNHNREILIDEDIDELWELLKDDEELEEFRKLCNKYYNVQRHGGMPHGNYKDFAILQTTKKDRFTSKRPCFRELSIDLYAKKEPFLIWFLEVTMDEKTDDIVGFQIRKLDPKDPVYEVKEMPIKIK